MNFRSSCAGSDAILEHWDSFLAGFVGKGKNYQTKILHCKTNRSESRQIAPKRIPDSGSDHMYCQFLTQQIKLFTSVPKKPGNEENHDENHPNWKKNGSHKIPQCSKRSDAQTMNWVTSLAICQGKKNAIYCGSSQEKFHAGISNGGVGISETV